MRCRSRTGIASDGPTAPNLQKASARLDNVRPQFVQGSLDDLAHALASGGPEAMEGVAHAAVAGLALPALPWWLSSASGIGGWSQTPRNLAVPGSPHCVGSSAAHRASFESTATSG